MGRRFPESGHRLAVGMDAAVPVRKRLSAVRAEPAGLVLGPVRGRSVVLGVCADPFVACGDHLLVAGPVSSRSAAG